MQVLFASGDIGGARGLLPVIRLCEKKSISFAVLEKGDIISYLSGHWKKIFPSEFDNQKPADFFRHNEIGVLVFSSSIKDSTALSLARHAKDQGVGVIHVLDSWTGYRRRMEIDGASPFVSDVYTVMDKTAYEGAIEDGIEASIIEITGQPALAGLQDEYDNVQKLRMSQKREDIGFDSNKALIAFISEPVESDQGETPDAPQFRGYTEKTVLRLFAKALQQYANSIEVAILQHPREDAIDLLKAWNECRGSLKGALTCGDRGRRAFFDADGVAGMASILLYEAWLLGKPVVSMQPGLLIEPLRMLEKRERVLFIDSEQDIIQLIFGWAGEIQPGRTSSPRSEMRMHENAPEKILMLIKKLLKQKVSSGVL